MSEPASHTLVKTLQAVPNFSPLDEAILLEILGASVNLYWTTGKTVFEAGESAEALYIVLSGRVRILETVGGEQRQVADLGPGDYFGENALLQEVTHTKSAVTSEETELLVLPKVSFQALMDSHPDLAERLERTLQMRDNAGDARAEQDREQSRLV